MKLQNIIIDEIDPNPEQPRTHFDEDRLADLAQSIEARGLIQPITVEAMPDGRYQLVGGERRLRASKLAGLSTITAVVHPCRGNGTGTTARLIDAIVENVQREDLNPIEEARAYGRLRDEHGMAPRDIADAVSRATPTVKSRLLLLELDPEIQNLVARGRLARDPRVAEAFLAVPSSEARVKLANRLAANRASIKAIVGAAKKLADRLTAETRASANYGDDAEAPLRALTPQHWPDPERREAWGTTRSAAAGACAACEANPGIEEPAWRLVMHTAEQTCGDCSIREMARRGNLSICRQCPTVDFLKRLITAARESYDAE